jgi:light-regulated signal transduction histidine kinase (bacteriophytochrome)
MAYTVDGAQRMQRLIHDLLAYSRVGMRDHVAAATVTDDVVAEALANLQAVITETGARIDVEPLPPVWADRGQLVRVFQNLVANAIKFQRESPPHVRVSATIDGTLVRFAVTDNGIGIDPAQSQRVFEVFKRLHPIGRYPGTGIGLAICRKIVECHGGTVWIESQPDHGATIFFTIPAAGYDTSHQPAGEGAA